MSSVVLILGCVTVRIIRAVGVFGFLGTCISEEGNLSLCILIINSFRWTFKLDCCGDAI